MTKTYPHSLTPRRALLLLLPALLVLLLAGCGRSGSQVEAAPIRTPKPTFTPTPAGQAAPAAPVATVPPIVTGVALGAEAAGDAPSGEPVVTASGQEAALPADTPAPEPTPTPASSGLPAVLPKALVNTELVNAREGPGTDFPVVLVLGIQETYDVTGKDASGGWWRICCVEEQDAWVAAEFVDVQGATDALPVAAAGEQSGLAQAGATPAGTGGPSAPQPEQAAVVSTAAPTPAPAIEVTEAPAQAEVPAEAEAPGDAAAPPQAGGSFTLAGQETFPETNVVRIFLYAYDSTGALEGYTLRVTKDGVEQPVVGQSFGGRAGLTWPLPDDRQRSQNFKAEFPGVAPAGQWTVELVQGGVAVGPAATFTLEANDPNRELYVRYEKQ